MRAFFAMVILSPSIEPLLSMMKIVSDLTLSISSTMSGLSTKLPSASGTALALVKLGTMCMQTHLEGMFASTLAFMIEALGEWKFSSVNRSSKSLFGWWTPGERLTFVTKRPLLLSFWMMMLFL